MKRFVMSFLMVLVTGCGGSLASENPAGEWSIEIETSGGFAGRGTGGVFIRSTGEVEATNIGGRSCVLTLPGGDLAALAGVVATEPHEWNAEYPAAGADMFHYSLTLVRRVGDEEIRFRAGWLDGSAGALPSDLRRLFDEAWRIRVVALSRCAESSS